MAPRSSQQRRTIAPQSEHIYELGVAGRKTGVTVKDTGIRDEHGMEPIDALFSSPSKPNGNSDDDSDDGSGEPMELTTNLGAGPAALLNGPAKRLSFPLPLSRSPVKTTLNSPAQRNRLLARSSSPTQGGPAFQNHRSQPAPKSRLDSKKAETNGSHAQPLFRKGMPKFSAASNGSRGYMNGYHPSDPSVDDDDADEDVVDEVEQLGSEDVKAFMEESIAMLTAETELDYGRDDDDAPVEEDGPVEESEAEPSPPPRAANHRRKPEPKPKLSNGAPPAKQRGRPPKAAPVVEEVESDREIQNGTEAEENAESEEEEGEEEEEAAPPPPRRRAGKEKAKAPIPEAQPPAKKRRSLNDVEAEEEAPASARQNKRQRTQEKTPEPPAKKRGRPTKSAEPSTIKASASKTEPAPKAKRGRKRKSSMAAGDTSMVAIPRGPPLPKSRGLLISRREAPGQANSTIKQTRSGRNSVRPLAYWRNERVDYAVEDATEDAFGPKSHPSKFLLPSIKEVVRVDEPEPVYPAKSRKGSKRGSGRPRKKRDDDDYDDEAAPEPWEGDFGTIHGNVVEWLPEHEFNPPAMDELVDVEEKQLAIAGSAVQTQPVKDASFRYAKTLSEGFFNCGVVDLPPGSEKRPKNSRKMFMSFFLHTGRVLVTVNETTFRISKGGMWFVPRGNYYSIENDYDQPARVFFSQGCEVAPRPISPEPEEEGSQADVSQAEA